VGTSVAGGGGVFEGAAVAGGPRVLSVCVFIGGNVIAPAPDEAAWVRSTSTVCAAEVRARSASDGPEIPNGKLQAVNKRTMIKIK